MSSSRCAEIPIQLRAFQPGDEADFRRLNEEWIARHFGMEEKDRITLSDPFGEILKPGGQIFFALAAFSISTEQSCRNWEPRCGSVS